MSWPTACGPRAAAERGARGPASAAATAGLPPLPGGEAPDRAGAAQHMQLRLRGGPGDGLEQAREPPAPVGPDPAPVLCLFPAPAHRAPGAAQEREVQHDDGVGGAQPVSQGMIVRAQVAIQDPGISHDQCTLIRFPPPRAGRAAVRLPEQRVELVHRQAGQLAKLPGQHRFACPAPAKNDHPAHTIMMPTWQVGRGLPALTVLAPDGISNRLGKHAVLIPG